MNRYMQNDLLGGHGYQLWGSLMDIKFQRNGRDKNMGQNDGSMEKANTLCHLAMQGHKESIKERLTD